MSGFLHIAWRTAGDIAGRVAGRLESSVPCMFDGLHAIGVDGTGRRKGHAYITVIVDHGRVVWAHDGHGRQVLGLFFRQLTPERRASIRIVTGDGAGWKHSRSERLGLLPEIRSPCLTFRIRGVLGIVGRGCRC